MTKNINFGDCFDICSIFCHFAVAYLVILVNPTIMVNMAILVNLVKLLILVNLLILVSLLILAFLMNLVIVFNLMALVNLVLWVIFCEPTDSGDSVESGAPDE